MMMRNSPWFFESSPLLGWGIPHDFPKSSPAMDLKSPWDYSPFQFHSSPMLGTRCWRLRVKWHKTRHTQETDDMHTPAGGTELGKKLIAIYYKSPQAEFQTAWISLFSTAQVHTCYRIAKGSEILVYCRVCTKPSIPSLSQEGNAPSFARDH